MVLLSRALLPYIIVDVEEETGYADVVQQLKLILQL